MAKEVRFNNNDYPVGVERDGMGWDGMVCLFMLWEGMGGLTMTRWLYIRARRDTPALHWTWVGRRIVRRR